jgi:hypothetical protein
MSGPDRLPKLCLYCGAADYLEKMFVHGYEFVAAELIKRGYPREKIAMLYDGRQPHHESAWAKYFPLAFKWIYGY